MSYRIRFHPRVGADLDGIAARVLEFAGPDAAERRMAEIETTFAKLAEVPHRGSLRDGIAPGLRAILAGRRTVVAFVVDDKRREVRVLAVAHAGADWMGRARERW